MSEELYVFISMTFAKGNITCEINYRSSVPVTLHTTTDLYTKQTELAKRETTWFWQLLNPLRALWHIRSTQEIANRPFCAKCLTWSQVNPFSFISLSNDFLRVSFGLYHPRLPALGVHLNAIFGIAPNGILITCPIQAHLLRLLCRNGWGRRCNSIRYILV